jgi:hypothetical protein
MVDDVETKLLTLAWVQLHIEQFRKDSESENGRDGVLHIVREVFRSDLDLQ